MIPMAMPLIKSRPPLVVQLAATPGQCSGRARTHPRFPGLRVFVGGGRSHEGHGGSTAARAAPQREQSSGASRHPSRWRQSWHSWAASSIPSSPDQAGVVSSSKLERSSADINSGCLLAGRAFFACAAHRWFARVGALGALRNDRAVLPAEV
eukprot:COSAG06_NODE_3623_length_5105_cov_2.312225_6_plen_152_part_00